MPVISLIIPLYNAVRHLRACLESVRAQTFSDFEVILVNDGSTDETESIVTKYCGKDKRFRLINQKNGGVSAARNRGMGEARAPFVAFLDQDDLLHPQAFEVMYQMITMSQADVAAFKIKIVPDSFSQDCVSAHFDPRAVAAYARLSFDPINDFFHDPRGAPIYIWNKLYRREAISALRFPVGVQPAEDTVFSIKVLLTVKSMVSTDAQLLYYRDNNASVTRQGITDKYIRSHALAAEELQSFLVPWMGKECEIQPRLAFYLSRFIFKSLISQPLRLTCGSTRREKIETACRFAQKLYACGALKPELLGYKKAMACRLFLRRCWNLAKLLV